MKTHFLIPGILMMLASPLVHSASMFESGPQRVNVLELYTSEGCSSCPPADRWLSELKQDDRLWKQLIPVAFHVDYWDYIGWPDRFASQAYSDRQRRYARNKGLSTIYTPGFLLNGAEWRSFFGLRRLSLDDSKNAGNLKLKIDQQSIEAIYQPAGKTINSPVLNIAILGFDLVSEVKAGENRGEQLKHDFTVLGYSTINMSPDADRFSVTAQLPGTSIQAPQTAIAAWISEQGDQTPVQAAGGWLTRDTGGR
jgi:hypothetical protein